MTRRASDAGMFAATAAIFPSCTATSSALLRSCAGSMTTPPFSTRSYMGEPPPTGCPESTRPASTLSSRACYRHPAAEPQEDGDTGKRREPGSIHEVFPHPHQGAGEGDRNQERDDVEQDGAGRARGEAEHRVHVADRPANHRPDHRRDRSAEAHVVAFER